MKKQIIWLGLIMAWMLCACEEDNKLMYDESSRVLNLWFGSESTEGRVDSTEYNYAYRPLGTDLDSVTFYVKLAGVPLEEDCTFDSMMTTFCQNIIHFRQTNHCHLISIRIRPRCGNIPGQLVIFHQITQRIA